MSFEPSRPCQHESPYHEHHEWGSVDQFLEDLSTIRDGLHSIQLGHGQHLDVLLRDAPLDPVSRVSSVFLNGAVTQRATKTPPFLSGAGMSKKLGLPLISFADPTLTLTQDLGLAWYLGARGVDVQGAIARILRAAIDYSGNDLWLVGGSGGGFAALQVAQRVGSGCHALVWNPQTDVLEYSPRLVKQFLESVYMSLRGQLNCPDWKDRARKVLAEDGVQWDLKSSYDRGILYDGLLLIQNWNDWHTRSHAVPWLKSVPGVHELWPGVYGTDSDHVLWFTEAGDGHTPPPAESVQRMLDHLAHFGISPLEVVKWGQRTELFPSAHQQEYVSDLRGQRALLEQAIQFVYLKGERIIPTLKDLNMEYGGVRFRYELVHGGQTVETKIARSGSAYVAEQPGRPWDYVKVTVLDGFNNELIETNFVNQSLENQ